MKFVKTNDGNIAAFVGPNSYYITPDCKNYSTLLFALQNKDVDLFKSSIIDSEKLNDFCQGYITFRNDVAYWDGIQMPDVFADRILELVSNGEEFDAIINFTANLAENPSDHSILELVDFLRHKYLPITKDGCFLAYKCVKPNYLDIYTGTIKNNIGLTPKVDRKEVDPDRDKECSYGLHVGCLEYVEYYGNSNGGVNIKEPSKSHNKVIVVKVNPKNVITVPTDHNFGKLRCCEYTVLADFTAPLDKAVYDDVLFFAKKEEPVQAEVVTTTKVYPKQEGWRENLRGKFMRILDIIKGKK
jgi:hypothetical protein